MSTSLAAQAGRTADRITLVSVCGHAAVAALGVFVAVQHDGEPDAQTWWGIAGFCALGLIATLLAWSSVKAGPRVWQAGVAVLLVSLIVLGWLMTAPSGVALALCVAVPLLFVDWLLFASARRALSAR